MVASIGAVASPAQGVSYYEKDSYYAKDSDAHMAASAWAGKGAVALGLDGPVTAEARQSARRPSTGGLSVSDLCQQCLLPACRCPYRIRAMTDGPTPHELSERIARLEERMKTMQAEYKTDIARLAEDQAKRDTEAARRDKDNLRWQVGLWIAAIVVLGFIIRLSAD